MNALPLVAKWLSSLRSSVAPRLSLLLTNRYLRGGAGRQAGKYGRG